MIPKLLRWIFLLALAAVHLPAQQGGFFTGFVRAPSGVPVPGAEIRVQNELTGARQKIYAGAAGRYATSELPAGTYGITVLSDGFRTLNRSALALQPGRTRALNFVIDVLPVQQEMTVEASADPASLDPASTGLTVSRGSAQSRLPANGRDIHALYSILPGATVTPASVGDGGQFTIDGQRPNANSFRIDGISGNTGIGIVAMPGSSPGATLPAMTTIGSTQSLASKEETERVELRAADFSADSGDRPGAQVDIETRSGSNDFHGSALAYGRPSILNSRDWFANSLNQALPAASLDGWGANLGGPLWKNHTYFFASLERTHVADTALQILPVPSLQARQSVRSSLAPALDAFPLPTAYPLTADESLGASPLLRDASLANYSFRLDQSFAGKVHLFARYSDVPSSATTLDLGTANSQFKWFSTTGGLTIATARTSHDLRFNYSQTSGESEHIPGQYSDHPEVQKLSDELFRTDPFVNPSPFFSAGANVSELAIVGVGTVLSGQTGIYRNRQWEWRYTFGRTSGKHTFLAGVDSIRLQPTVSYDPSALALAAAGTSSLLAGAPLGVTLGSLPGESGDISTSSIFAQDAFRPLP